MNISQTCEVWAVIDGFTRYEVSTHGRVRVRATGHILSPDINNTGYPTVRLLADGTNKKTHLNIHRIEAFAFLPNISECVNHIDGNKANNHISNLEWCTYSRNNQHAYDMGLKHAWMQKISSEDRLIVADMLRKGIPIKEVAEHFDVSEGCIYQLITRKQVVV